jgi:magnesium-protoporphyrin IX monomethyl ester (oxidative) cyclase
MTSINHPLETMKIALVNMPFGMTCMPSLGLAQLEAVLREQVGERVQVTTHYLNLDFARQVEDQELYHHPYSPLGFMTDAGEWLFRDVAFPEAGDNTRDYLNRYYFDDSPDSTRAREFLLGQRPGLESCLEALIDRHQLAEVDVVGFTLLFSQTVASLALARLLKRRNPDIITIMGGAACEGEMGQVIVERVPQVDYCFSGPALVSFSEFVRRRLAGDVAGCDRINGVFSKTNRVLWGDGTGGTLAPLGDDLDINANIMPDYSGFLEAHARLLPNPSRAPVLLFETSRGCARAQGKACRFCGLNGLNARYRQMKPENAIRQISALWRDFPGTRFLMAVDNLMPSSYPREVFPKLSPPKGKAMRYEVRTDLSEADIQALCRGGATWLQPGIESLATSTLTLMRKGVDAFSNLRFLKVCVKVPVTLEWNLLIGTPGEAESVYEKYLRDIPLLMHLPPPTGVFPVMFVKYSDYYDHPEDYGLSLQPQEVYSYIFPFSPADCRRVASRYSDANASPFRLDMWLERLNGLVRRWRDRWAGQDGKPAAQLCLTQDAGEPCVYDTRSGEPVWHFLTPGASTLLHLLEKPVALTELMASFPHDEVHLQKDLDHLVAQGLVFEEDGLLMSLVVS